MREPIRHRLGSLIDGRPSRAILETLLYTLGAGVFFYLVDVVFMRWQGLTLH